MEQLQESSSVAESDHQFQYPVSDEYLAGETVFHWVNREQYRRFINAQKAEMTKVDIVLAELLYRMKRKLSRLGRNGAWSAWLKQNKIARSTADRLVLGYAESHGLANELPHREGDPLEATICGAAHRTSDRLERMLKSPESRLDFIHCLASFFDLRADGDADSVRLSLPRQFEADDQPDTYLMPNVIQLDDNGIVVPVDYELRYEPESVFYPEPCRTGQPYGQRERNRELLQ